MDLTTILARLRARNEQLDRALEGALRRCGITRQSLAQLAELRVDRPTARYAAVEQRLRRELPDTAARAWEEVCRPSFDEVNREGRATLWRA